MNKLSKITTAVALALGIAATAAYAHEGPGRGSMERGAQQGRHHGMEQHGGRHARGKHEGRKAGRDGDRRAARGLMTPEERTAFREKMRAAKTPEERQQLALANRTEMQKRAAEKGITLPEHREGRGHGHRRGSGPATAPAAPESAN